VDGWKGNIHCIEQRLHYKWEKHMERPTERGLKKCEMPQNMASCKVCMMMSTTNLLTPWSRVFLGKLTGSQLVKKFPAL
jgi:hypothetical protein